MFGTTTAKGPCGNIFYEFIHHAFGSVRVTSTLRACTLHFDFGGRTGVFRRREGHLLATLHRVSPSAVSSSSLGSSLPASPAAAGQLSLLRCLLLLRRLLIYAGCISTGADGCGSRLRSSSSLAIVSSCTSWTRCSGAARRVSRPRLSTSSGFPSSRFTLMRVLMRISTFLLLASRGLQCFFGTLF